MYFTLAFSKKGKSCCIDLEYLIKMRIIAPGLALINEAKQAIFEEQKTLIVSFGWKYQTYKNVSCIILLTTQTSLWYISISQSVQSH